MRTLALLSSLALAGCATLSDNYQLVLQDGTVSVRIEFWP